MYMKPHICACSGFAVFYSKLQCSIASYHTEASALDLSRVRWGRTSQMFGYSWPIPRESPSKRGGLLEGILY